MVRVTNCANGYNLSMESIALTRRVSLVDLLADKSEIIRIPPGSGETSVFLPIGGMASSYGMNSKAGDILDRPGKVLVMDFAHPVAFPDDIWFDFYHPDGHGPVFARHNNRMNVLFSDGAVRLTEPEVVDPIRASVGKTYWLP
jgi:prepilin-type processing-associated H-X9-DG protein